MKTKSKINFCALVDHQDAINTCIELIDALEVAIQVIKENKISSCAALEAVVKKAKGE